ncbi:coiled-coil membrane protein [Suhomyces tanzawaensis NRRL Y-17324]|uniref:Golgi to ER traffic protein 1 n=1 Tax=Suhomyces tanzawaensis NRRL Y-17324 TaxID=984487 RepID=A0A1E4SJH5_9ASCO|nr:coiled-coil membrane protein [Suhomyces tanzawaensis NRRL Y-17324]ODV79665.1 coiled-coil membrane protein [Suhomyces tanzawaensis NRRL Y-17324]
MLDLHPYTILLLVFIVLLFKHAINEVGKNNIQDWAWGYYIKFGSRIGLSQFAEYNQKKTELNKVNREKRSISAQDQYAKWTKLNRQADKLTAEIKSLDEHISQNKAGINRVVGLVTMVLTTLPIWGFRVLFRKSVLFYFPTGVLPYYLEWFLALPFIKTGGVGLTIWMFTVNSVLSSLALLVSFPFEKPVSKPVKQTRESKDTKTDTKAEIKADTKADTKATN